MGRSPSLPRKPSRANGRKRYQTFLAALEQLLRKLDSVEISLADIAEEANVPVASIYHFFPTRLAAFVGLADRYSVELEERYNSWVIAPADVNSWEDFIVRGFETSVAYHNSNPLYMKLLHDSECSPYVYRLNLSSFERAATDLYEAINRHFFAPPFEAISRPLHLSMAIAHQIWGTSYIKHGLITDEYRSEATVAVTTYLRCYLPQFMPIRPLEERVLSTKEHQETLSRRQTQKDVQIVPHKRTTDGA